MGAWLGTRRIGNETVCGMAVGWLVLFTYSIRLYDSFLLSSCIHRHSTTDWTWRGENTFVVPEESVKNAWVRRETALEVHGLDVKDHWLAQPKL